MARLEFLELVGPGAERRLERGGGYIASMAACIGAIPPVHRQNRQLSDDLRQFAVSGRVEREGDLALARLFRLCHVPVIGAELRAVLLERVEGKNDVVRRHRLAVMPA